MTSPIKSQRSTMMPHCLNLIRVEVFTIRFFSMEKVNYPPTAEPMGRASGVADSPNGNASSRFCFVSDRIPQPDNRFIPSLNIFFAALTSLSCTAPQDPQVHSLMESVRSCFVHPQLEHVLLLGKNLSTLTNCPSFHLALYSSMV